MKVLFTFGGLPHYYNYVLNRLHSLDNVEVVVVAPKETGSSIGAGVHQSMEGIEFKVRFLEEYQDFYGKAFFRGFTQVLKEEKPNIIVTCWPYVLGFVYHPGLLLQVKRMGIKLIMKEIPFKVPKLKDSRRFYREGGLLSEDLNTDLKRGSLLFTLKYDLVTVVRWIYYHLMDAHVNYVEEAFDIVGSYGVDKKRIFITYNSPDTDRIFAAKKRMQDLPAILPPNPYRLLHVGRLVKWKRVEMLIDVVSRLKKVYPQTELVVIGKGPEEENLKNQVQQLGLTDSVHFVGAIYDIETLGRYFQSASVYVLAGMGGLSINEAMCFDRAVVCSEADGTEKKLVREDYNGKYFTDGSADDLYQTLESLLSDPDKLREMGKNSGRIIREEVNIHTVIDGYVRAFNFVTNNYYRLHYDPQQWIIKE